MRKRLKKKKMNQVAEEAAERYAEKWLKENKPGATLLKVDFSSYCCRSSEPAIIKPYWA